jgi:hypothetical protein
MMRMLGSRAASSLALILAVPAVLAAQRSPWQFRPDIVVGILIPGRELGEIGPTAARLRSAPAIGLGLQLDTPTPWLAFRVSGTLGVSTGLHFHGTSVCTNHCGVFTDPHGRFLAGAVDAIAEKPLGAGTVFMGIGAGLSGYLVGGFDTTGPAPNGTAYPDPFLGGHTAVAIHAVGGFLARVGSVRIRATIEDYIGRGFDGARLHDIVIAAGLVLGRFD